jgi:4-phytase/acid phosphatase
MRLAAPLVAFILAAQVAVPAVAAPEDRLEKVVIVSRHGVRAAMSTPEQLETASARPWPRFSVPPGHLTAHGATLETMFGTYYRALYTSQGLLDDADCGAVYYWANVVQRTIATAKALSEGLSPGCAAAVHTVGEGKADPLFEPVKAGVVKPDLARARAAVEGRVGGDLAAWSASHRDAIETLDTVLMQCATRPCPAGTGAGKRRIFDVAPAFVGGDETVEITGPEAFASGVTESLLMAWADGQDFAGLGWKGLDAPILLKIFAPHQAEFDLRLRTPYVARTVSGRLASRLLATLEPGDVAKSGEGAIGEAGSRIVVIVGHDGTLATLGGLLDLEWSTPGYQPNQIAPGGALVFERWLRADGVRVIRARYTVQSLSQLRERKPLSLAAPPEASPIFIPGCSEAGPAFDCPVDRFAAVVKAAVFPL